MNYPEKIQLVLTYKHTVDDAEIFTEKVDAIKQGDYYKIMHVPAFAPNIAYGDTVTVEFEDGEFHFDKLIEESGFSTVHIVIWKPECKDRLISVLNTSGCGVNTHVADNYVVVSIPPEAMYQSIRTMLLKEESFKTIDFRESLSQIHAAYV